ncbi:MAG TPA: hypothetical protein VNG12_08375, partial [Acidimicrobiales bacterium]|nr:hypothetical protein [Acidimicrobiales bacterium]
VTGSPAPPIWGDGWTIWFLSWHKLLAGSATGRPVLAGRSGSEFLAPPPSGHHGPQALVGL